MWGGLGAGRGGPGCHPGAPPCLALRCGGEARPRWRLTSPLPHRATHGVPAAGVGDGQLGGGRRLSGLALTVGWAPLLGTPGRGSYTHLCPAGPGLAQPRLSKFIIRFNYPSSE